MPSFLTSAATFVCPHGGTGTVIPSTPLCVVGAGGAVVLVEGDVGVLACPMLLMPCVGFTLRSMGLNTTTIAGRRAILSTDVQFTVTGLPLAIIEPQLLARDDSQPGGGALPPTLTDDRAPTVLTPTPVLAFDSTTQLPFTLPVTFTITGENPGSWSLVLINTALKTHVDLTGGVPPGAVVVPAGGAWTTPTLLVTLTLTAPFMTALGKTPTEPHEFYLTAVTPRGIAAHAKATLLVT